MKTDYHDCFGQVFNNWRWHHCQRHATIVRDGKWYCTSHDPIKIAERREKSHQHYLAKCCPCGWELKKYWSYCPHCGKRKMAKL
jgi:hypothetical protein